MEIPDDVQRRIVKSTPEAVTQAATKHRIFGRRSEMAREQKCTCLCLAPDERSTTCTLLDGTVQRQTSELCKAVCFSRSPLRMLLRLVRRIVQFCDARHTGERSLIRVTLQVDSPGEKIRRADRPYLLNACFDQSTSRNMRSRPTRQSNHNSSMSLPRNEHRQTMPLGMPIPTNIRYIITGE